MSEPNSGIPGSGQPVSQSIIPPITQAQTPIDPKAKMFTDKLMELIGEVYTLSLEIASIDDANLLNHPAIKQAKKVIQKVKELKDVLGTK
jgi:hypothetical protein